MEQIKVWHCETNQEQMVPQSVPHFRHDDRVRAVALVRERIVRPEAHAQLLERDRVHWRTDIERRQHWHALQVARAPVPVRLGRPLGHRLAVPNRVRVARVVVEGALDEKVGRRYFGARGQPVGLARDRVAKRAEGKV